MLMKIMPRSYILNYSSDIFARNLEQQFQIRIHPIWNEKPKILILFNKPIVHISKKLSRFGFIFYFWGFPLHSRDHSLIRYLVKISHAKFHRGIRVLLSIFHLLLNNYSTHYSKSQIFVQKFNFDKAPTFSRVFHPKFFWQIFSWNQSRISGQKMKISNSVPTDI